MTYVGDGRPPSLEAHPLVPPRLEGRFIGGPLCGTVQNMRNLARAVVPSRAIGNRWHIYEKRDGAMASRATYVHAWICEVVE